MLDTLFLKVLDMTATGSLVILAILPVRLLLKKAPKIFSYALWAVVLFRLLCPVAPAAPVSLLPQRESVAQSYDLSQVPISPVGAGIAAYQLTGDILNGGLGMQHVPTTGRDTWGNTEYITTDWWNVVLLAGQYLWLMGVAVMGLCSALSYGKLRKKLREAVPLEGNVLLADGIPTPFVVGFLRPKIYLPGGLTQQQQAYILLHERQHIRRGDPAWKLLGFLVLCLHWFNPLVWLAFRLGCRDMEMSCDEAVLKKIGSHIRADYAASLLTLATGRQIIGGTPLAFGEGDPKGRIRNLSKWKKPALWVLAVVTVCCIVLGVCLLTDPVKAPQGESTPSGETVPVTGEERLAPGVYIPTGCLYMNPLSSYFPANLSEDYRYTVTENCFITEGILIENGSYSVDVNWHWQTLQEAGKQLAFFKDTPYYRMLTTPGCRIQPLGQGTFLIQTQGRLYLLKGGIGKEALWFIYTLEPKTHETPQLTLAKVLELSKKGEDLTWADLEGFGYEDIGSGLYICNYPINAAFTLRVSDGKQEGAPMQVLLVSTLTGASVEIRREDVPAFIEAMQHHAREVMIEEAIKTELGSHVNSGQLFVSSHNVLANEVSMSAPLFGSTQRAEKETVYLQIVEKRYNIYAGIPTEIGGSSLAAAITFRIDEAGQYQLEEFWIPGLGGDYAKDIRAKFPGEAAEAALDDTQYETLAKACYEKACANLSPENTLRDQIEALFLEVASSPAQSSAPIAYIQSHPEQWQALIAYGAPTLEYCFSEFTPSGQKGLLELLMALACEEILNSWGEAGFPAVEGHSNGGSWFNHFQEYTQLLPEQKSYEEIEKHHPGAWLLMQMRSPSVVFTALEAGEREVADRAIHFARNGGSIYYHVTYSSATSILEVGLVNENGQKIATSVSHGAASGYLRDIPAGTWQLYVQYSAEASGAPHTPVSGVLNSTVHPE